MSVAYPQVNEQVEVANRIILDGLRKRIEKSKNNWVDDVLPIPWAYHATCRVTTRATPFLLAYWKKQLFLWRYLIPLQGWRLMMSKKMKKGKRLALDWIDEICVEAHARIVKYQTKTSS